MTLNDFSNICEFGFLRGDALLEELGATRDERVAAMRLQLNALRDLEAELRAGLTALVEPD